MSRASSAITVPGYIGLSLVAGEAIVVLFGAKWAPSATAASILFLTGPVLAIQAFSGAVWNAVGHPGVSLRFRLISTVTNVVGFLLAVAVFTDIAAVAAAYTLRAYALLPLNLYWMQKYAAVPVREQLWQLRGIFGATALMAVAVLAVKFVVAGQLHPAATLMLEVGVGVVTFVAGLAVFDRPLLRDVIQIGLQVVPGATRLARRLGIQVDPAAGVATPVGADARAYVSADDSADM